MNEILAYPEDRESASEVVVRSRSALLIFRTRLMSELFSGHVSGRFDRLDTVHSLADASALMKEKGCYDYIFVQLSLRHGKVSLLIEELKAASPGSKIVAFYDQDVQAGLLSIIGDGVVGMIGPETGLASFNNIITLLEGGDTFISPSMLKPRRAQQSASRHSFTEKEVEVLRLVSDGLGNREIATCLKIAEPTVKARLHGICRKLGVKNRRLASIEASALGVI